MKWFSIKDYLPESGETVLAFSKVDPDLPASELDNAAYTICVYYKAGDAVFNEAVHKPVEGAESMDEDELREAVYQMMEEDEEVEIGREGFYKESVNEKGLMEWRRLATVLEHPMGISHWCYIDPPEDD